MDVVGKNPRGFDQFFTKPELAADCVNSIQEVLEIKLNEFKLIVEPSFGQGAFVKYLQKHVSEGKLLYMDIDAKNKKYRHDFLKYNFKTKNINPCLTLGNPPFGKNSSIAIQFFNKACTFSDVIAFILPKTFCKVTVQNKLDENFFQVSEREMPKGGFLFEGKSYDVPCVFQIWVHRKFVDKIPKRLANWGPHDLRPIIPSISETSHFDFVKKTENPDLVLRRVGVYAGRMYLDDPENHTQENHLFLKRKPKMLTKQKLISNIKNLNLENADFKYATAGMPCINKGELSRLYIETYLN